MFLLGDIHRFKSDGHFFRKFYRMIFPHKMVGGKILQSGGSIIGFRFGSKMSFPGADF